MPRCRRPDGTFYGTSGQCRKGTEDNSSDVDSNLLWKGVNLTEEDLDLMQGTWERYLQTGRVDFPFKIPSQYDDKSGAVEACEELANLRDSLVQDRKTGKITIPEGTKIGGKAKELVDEWNSLDLSRVYVDSKRGNQLNTSGLGVMAGPRDSVPKDAIRGLIQYVALRRQDANLIQTEKGMVIDSYRDPFTGKRRPFEGEIPLSGGKSKIDVVASQDHWERPFGVYGIKSENDVRNTVYMPLLMNTTKGESSPARYLERELVKNGRIKGDTSVDGSVLDGFAKRYSKDRANDRLPQGITREGEQRQIKETSQWMIEKSNSDIQRKYVPKIQKAVSSKKVTSQEAAKLLTDIAKQELDGNYYGKYIRTSGGERIFTNYESSLFKNLKPMGSGKLQKEIETIIKRSGEDPNAILMKVLSERS